MTYSVMRGRILLYCESVNMRHLWTYLLGKSQDNADNKSLVVHEFPPRVCCGGVL